MLKDIKFETSKVSNLTDLSSVVDSALNSVDVIRQVEELVNEEYLSHVMFYKDGYFEDDNLGANIFLVKKDGDDSSLNTFGYHELGLNSVESFLKEFLDKSLIEKDFSLKSLNKISASPNYEDKFIFRINNNFSMYNMTDNLYVPIVLDEENSLFVIGVYKLSVGISDEILDFKDDKLRDELYYSKLTPKGAIVYSEKYGVRYYNNLSNASIKSRLLLPHNVPKYLSNVYTNTVYNIYNIYITSKKDFEVIKNSITYKSFLDFMKKYRPDSVELREVYDSLYVQRGLELSEVIKSNPSIFFEKFNDFPFLSYISLLKTSKKRTKLTHNNIFDVSSISNKDVIAKANKYFLKKYTIAQVSVDGFNPPYQNIGDIKIKCSCGEVLNGVKEGKVNICSSCNEKYFPDIKYIYSVKVDEEDVLGDPFFDIDSGLQLLCHSKIEDDWINYNNMELNRLDMLDPLGFSEKVQVHNAEILNPSSSFFINEEVLINNKYSVFTKAYVLYLKFFIDNSGDLDFKWVIKSIYISNNGKEYFFMHNMFNRYVEEDDDLDKVESFEIRKRLTPSEFESKLVFDVQDMICLNKKETESIHYKYDEYKVINHYADLMSIDKDSELYYSSMAYLEGFFAKYILDFPMLEALIKSNYSRVARDIFTKKLQSKEIKKLFNVNETKPRAICKLNRININLDEDGVVYDLDFISQVNYIQYIAEYNNLTLGNITNYTVNMMSVWVDHGVDSIESFKRSISEVVSELKDNNISLGKSLFNTAQIIEYAGRCYDIQCMDLDEFDYLWRDYVKMAIQLNYDLSDKSILYPDSLKREHDIASRLYEKVFTTKEREMFNIAVSSKSYSRLADISHGKYIVIAPSEAEDLVNEGVSLNHCVASYVSNVIRGSSNVLFLRYSDKPKDSLYTIEVQKREIIQARGKHNISIKRDKDAYNFLQIWANQKGLKLSI